MWRRLIFVGLISGLGILSLAQTIMPDSILENRVLTLGDSPCIVQQKLVIGEGVTLKIDAGVQLIISKNVAIWNHGRLIVEGKTKSPVLFTAAIDSEKWAYIYNYGSFFASDLLIRNATRFITSYGDTVIIDHCDVRDTYGTVGDDCVGVHNAKKVSVLSSYFIGNPEAGKTDALDIDAVSEDTIYGNTITLFSDDGIDIGTESKDIYISGNKISKCDMGISVGENSTAQLDHNLIFDCAAGIQSHFGSVVIAQQNTLFGNLYGLRVYHNSSETTSAGTIHVSNSILSGCRKKMLLLKENSVVTLNYCLTDSVYDEGVGNIYGSAGFVDTIAHDFRLSGFSMAVDAGDPSKTDADGSRLDMGYVAYYHSPLRIVEVAPSNLSLVASASGAYADWFKIYNESDVAINMIHYFLSDNADKAQKYQIDEDIIVRAKDSLTFWTDEVPLATEYHVPFKLSGEGEYLSLSNPEGILLDELSFPRVPVDMVYKRVEGSDEWVYSEFPAGGDSKTYEGLCGAPIYFPPGGAPSFPYRVSLGSDLTDEDIYYSLDVSNPEDGLLFKDTLDLSEPVTLRAVTMKTGYLSSYVHAETYFAANAYHLPVLSLSTNEENLYGPQGIHDNYAKSSNFWERPVAFAYDDGNLHFSQIAGIRIQGGNSVWMPKKSFRLHFRGGYGQSRLEASPFASGPSSFKNLVLRSGYDDDITNVEGTMLRDPFSTDLWAKLGELATESAWGVLLLNNEYRGIYNIRESINEYFVNDHLGYNNFDLVRFQKTGPDLKYGSWDEWNNLMEYFDTTNFSRQDVYEELAGFVDMNSMLNLLSFVHCTQFRSWTWGAFMVKPASGKWHWTIWDTDRSFNQISWNGFLEYANTSAEKWPNFMPQKMLLNEEFRIQLINRNCDLLNSLFIPEDAITIYDSLVQILSPEMDAEYARWSSGNRARWESNNESIRDFLRDRPAALYTQMKSYFQLEDTVHLKVEISGKGSIRLNSLLLNEEKWKGVYMKGIPVTLEAIPDRGSNFIEFRDISGAHIITVDPEVHSRIVAVFSTDIQTGSRPLVINEIMYNPLSPESSEWIEIYNPNTFSLSLENYSFTDEGLGNKFIFPAGTVIDPEDYLLLAGDLSLFGAEFGLQKTVNGSFNNGSAGFRLSNGGETISLWNADGELMDQVSYKDYFPWPLGADGMGPSLQLESPDRDNLEADYWLADNELLCTPGEANSLGSGSASRSSSLQYRLYPNPVDSELFIDLPADIKTDIRLKIYTLSGTEVASCLIESGAQRGTINWAHGLKTQGMYILKIEAAHANTNLVKTQLLIYSGR